MNLVIDTMLQVQSFLRDKGIIICFSGKLSQELIEEYGAAVKKYLLAEDRPVDEVYHIFSIFIEQTQNIKNYCGRMQADIDYEEINTSCIVTIGKTEEGSYISSGNLLKHEDGEALVQRLNELRELDAAAIRKLYKAKLREELPPDAEGSGLGLIEMARKSSKPLEYTVSRVNESLSFFTLRAIV